MAYNSLWNYSGTTVSSTNNGISYGGTQPDQIGPALVKYAKDKSVSLTYQRKVSPSFSDIQTKIAQSYPVAFTYFTINLTEVLEDIRYLPKGHYRAL